MAKQRIRAEYNHVFLPWIRIYTSASSCNESQWDASNHSWNITSHIALTYKCSSIKYGDIIASQLAAEHSADTSVVEYKAKMWYSNLVHGVKMPHLITRKKNCYKAGEKILQQYELALVLGNSTFRAMLEIIFHFPQLSVGFGSSSRRQTFQNNTEILELGQFFPICPTLYRKAG